MVREEIIDIPKCGIYCVSGFAEINTTQAFGDRGSVEELNNALEKARKIIKNQAS